MTVQTLALKRSPMQDRYHHTRREYCLHAIYHVILSTIAHMYVFGYQIDNDKGNWGRNRVNI